MTKNEALLMAIEALDNADYHKANEAITAIKATLEAKDEPLTENGMYRLGYHNGYGFGEADGTANAPERTWVGLTDDDKVLLKHDANFNQFMTAGEYADRVQQLTEARLKDLNT